MKVTVDYDVLENLTHALVVLADILAKKKISDEEAMRIKYVDKLVDDNLQTLYKNILGG